MDSCIVEKRLEIVSEPVNLLLEVLYNAVSYTHLTLPTKA